MSRKWVGRLAGLRHDGRCLCGCCDLLAVTESVCLFACRLGACCKTLLRRNAQTVWMSNFWTFCSAYAASAQPSFAKPMSCHTQFMDSLLH